MQIRRYPPNPAVRVDTMSFQVAAADAQPLHILEEIIWHKEREVEQMRNRTSLTDLQRQVVQTPPSQNFVQGLRQSKTCPGVIAEVKKASPSKGVLREDFDPVEIAQAYERNGATCISVLTDVQFFQGSFENLSKIRRVTQLPLLCKDFFIYPYQIYLARICGADAILLIAAVLTNQDLQYFLKIAKSLDMAALIEVHTAEELERVLRLEGAELVGINNRNLKTFSTTLQTTQNLLQQYGPQLQERDIVVVSESGMRSAADLQQVATLGCHAVLVGESLVRQSDPGSALAQLLDVVSV